MHLARNSLLLLPLAFAASGDRDADAAAAAPSPLADLAWLAGTWRAETEDGGFHEETWSAPRGDAMCGMYCSAERGGRVTLYELMSFELEGPELPAAGGDGPIIPGQERGAPQRLLFRLRHFDRGLAPWKSEADGPLRMEVRSLAENQVVLEASERDFPRTVTYAREGDQLTIRLRAADPDGRRLDFTLRRAGS